jgi:Sulfocyanin (SoxE) domain
MSARTGPMSALVLALTVATIARSQAAPTDRQGSPLSYAAATKTVTFQLEAGTPGAKSPFNFNGYTNGEATLAVPAKSKVVMNFLNKDGTPHSAVIIADREPMPSTGGDPAIPGAYTKDLVQGLPQGGKDVMRFTAPDGGSYRVDPAAKAPSWATRK